jgi:hypothetical protein
MICYHTHVAGIAALKNTCQKKDCWKARCEEKGSLKLSECK